jgi:FtsH-binding integral membrane protein
MKNNFSLDDLFDFSDLSPSTQHHLRRVYTFLSSGIAVAILCFMLAQYFPSFSGVFTALGVFSLIADIIMIFVSRSNPHRQRISLASLYGYASSVGGVLGSYLPGLEESSRMAMYRYMMSALVSVLVIFVLFSVFALLTSNRSGIYAMVIISSLILSILGIFMWGYSSIISAIVSSLYIVTDTQQIIRRQKMGGSDAVYDAKMLFVDLVQLFYKILQHLQKKDKEEKKKKDD